MAKRFLKYQAQNNVLFSQRGYVLLVELEKNRMVRRNGIFSFDAKLEELVDECEHRESALSATRAEPPHLKKSLFSLREFLCYVSLSRHIRMRKGEKTKRKRGKRDGEERKSKSAKFSEERKEEKRRDQHGRLRRGAAYRGAGKRIV